jgi:Flp pilus assembly protein TadD
MGDGRAAQAAFAEATRRDPSSWRAWYDLAIAWRGIERRRALFELRRLDPLSGEAAPGGAPGPPLGR